VSLVAAAPEERTPTGVRHNGARRRLGAWFARRCVDSFPPRPESAAPVRLPPSKTSAGDWAPTGTVGEDKGPESRSVPTSVTGSPPGRLGVLSLFRGPSSPRNPFVGTPSRDSKYPRLPDGLERRTGGSGGREESPPAPPVPD